MLVNFSNLNALTNLDATNVSNDINPKKSEISDQFSNLLGEILKNNPKADLNLLKKELSKSTNNLPDPSKLLGQLAKLNELFDLTSNQLINESNESSNILNNQLIDSFELNYNQSIPKIEIGNIQEAFTSEMGSLDTIQNSSKNIEELEDLTKKITPLQLSSYLKNGNIETIQDQSNPLSFDDLVNSKSLNKNSESIPNTNLKSKTIEAWQIPNYFKEMNTSKKVDGITGNTNLEPLIVNETFASSIEEKIIANTKKSNETVPLEGKEFITNNRENKDSSIDQLNLATISRFMRENGVKTFDRVKNLDNLLELTDLKNTSIEKVVELVSQYITKLKIGSNDHLSLVFQDKNLGKIKLYIEKGAEQFEVRIMAGKIGHEFFSKNQELIVSGLKDKGLDISLLVNFFSAESSEQMMYTKRDPNAREDSKRRQKLWQEYQERIYA